MSEFHYVRTFGEDGGVDVADGHAVGIALSEVLDEGLPPFKIALEVIAGLCELLDIMDEDQEVHGNITTDSLFLDDTGAISLEGLGAQVGKTLSPEDKTAGTATDLFGLGYIAFCLLCPHAFKGPDTDNPDDWDDAIIDVILGINFEGMPEEMVGDIQWYLAKLMSFDPKDRPTAVETWRTFIAFSDGVEGVDFAGWCLEAVQRGGERRDEEEAGRAPEPPTQEVFESPLQKKGPLARGEISFGDGGSAGGAKTAFWSRDAMKAALEDVEEEEDDGFRPSVGGGAATSFWTPDQMQAMREGSTDAPRPKRTPGEGKRRATMFMTAPSRPVPQAPPPPQPGDDEVAFGSTAPPAPTSPSHDGGYGDHVESGADKPVAETLSVEISGPMVESESPEDSGGFEFNRRNPWLWGCAGLLLISICCGGGTAAYYVWQDGDVRVEDKQPAKKMDVKKATPKTKTVEEDTGSPAKAEKEEIEKPKEPPKKSTRTKSTKSSSSSSRSSSSSGSKKRTSSSSRPAPKKKAPPPPAPPPVVVPPPPPTGPANVSFKSRGRGTIACAGQLLNFDGPINMSIEAYQLPQWCMVRIDDKKGIFEVVGSGMVNCDVVGSEVSCGPQKVGQ